MGIRAHALALLALVACTSEPPAQTKPMNKTLTLGELVYRVIRDSLAGAKSCGTAYVDELSSYHDDVVAALDVTVTKGLPAGQSDILGKTIQPSVADGSLPLLVKRVGAALGLLVSDDFDPARATLQAVLSLTRVPTLFESTMVTSLASALPAQPDLPTRVH